MKQFISAQAIINLFPEKRVLLIEGIKKGYIGPKGDLITRIYKRGISQQHASVLSPRLYGKYFIKSQSHIMKKVLLTIIIIVSSFAASNAQIYARSAVMKEETTCFDDAKIKTYDKCFFVSFTVRGADGIIRCGYMGIKVPKGVPNTLHMKASIARDQHVKAADIVIFPPSAISNADYASCFEGRKKIVVPISKRVN